MRVCLLGFVATALCGCGSPSGGFAGAGRSGEIGALHLFVMPAASPAEARGAVGTIAVRVFASGRQRAQGIAIRNGTLDVLAFEGVVSERAMAGTQPTRVWSFPAASLAPHAATSSLGTGYELALPWEGARPAGGRLTLAVQHRQGSHPVVLSAPIVISTGVGR